MDAEHIDDELLQRMHDGDLETSQSQSVQAHLGDCHECTDRSAEFGQLSRLMRASAEDMGSQVDSEALFARISGGIEAEAEAEAQPSAAKAATPTGGGLAAWWGRLLPLAGAVGVAAAVLLTLYQEPGEDLTNPGGTANTGGVPDTAAANPQPTPEDPPASAQANTGAPAPNSEVVQVDFGNNTGTVFAIDMPDGTSTPVVWINDEE